MLYVQMRGKTCLWQSICRLGVSAWRRYIFKKVRRFQIKRKTHLVVDFAWGHSCIAEVIRAAVRGVKAAAWRNAFGGVIHTSKPAGVVVDSTTAQL